MKTIFKVLFIVILSFSLVACVNSVDVESLVGSYQDITSKRAIAQINKVDDETVEINIEWSSSASQYDQWIIKAKITGNRLTYGEHDFTHLSSIDEENTTIVIDPPGYFEIIDGTIAWVGSGVSDTSSCIFEKIN